MTETTKMPKLKLGVILTGLFPVPLFFLYMQWVDHKLKKEYYPLGEPGHEPIGVDGNPYLASMLTSGLWMLMLIIPLSLLIWCFCIRKYLGESCSLATAIAYLVTVFMLNYFLLFAGCVLGLDQ